MINLYYLILAHDHPWQLVQLIESLHTDKTFFYIHVDGKVALAPFMKATKALDSQRVIFLRNRVSCKWGNISLVKATILLLQKLYQQQSKRGYVILLSGKHYPIKSNQFIQQFFTQYYGKIFMETRPVYQTNWPLRALDRIREYYFFPTNSRKFITSVPQLKTFKSIFKLPGRKRKIFALCNFFKCVKKRIHPANITPYVGSQWWCLPFETGRLMLKFIEKNPDLLRFHRDSFAPDEMYFQTVIRALSTINVEEQIIQDNQVFIDWGKHNYNRPAVLDKAYLSALKLSSKLFARKFDFKQNDSLYDLIEIHCRQSDFTDNRILI